MREAVAQRELTVVSLVLIDEAHESVLAFEPLERVLDVFFSPVEYRGQERSVEIDSLNAGRPEQATVPVVERIDLALHQAAHRLGQLTGQRRQILGDDPLAILLLEHLTPAKVAQQIDDEERVAFGA